MRIIPHTWRCCFLLVLFRLLRFFPSLLTLWSLGLKGFLSLLLLQFRELGFHLDDQHLELLFTLLAGVSIDIAGVLFAVWPFGGVASFKQVVVDLGTAIVLARVRKPQDKSAAAASVRLVETWIIAALRDKKFFSLRELNEAVAEKLEELNSRNKQHIGTRRSAYLEEEQAYMLPLPAAPWSRQDLCAKLFAGSG